MSDEPLAIKVRERLDALRKEHQQLSQQLAVSPIWQRLVALEASMQTLLDLLGEETPQTPSQKEAHS